MKRIFLIAIALLGAKYAPAQNIDRQVISSGGNYVSAGGAQVSYTIGETAIQYLSSAGASLSQGFQQSDENSTTIRNTQKQDAVLTLYPNPFIDYIDIKSNKIIVGATFNLADVSGKSVTIKVQETQPGQHWKISSGNLAAGNYWLSIICNGQISTFVLSHVTQ